MPKEGEWYLKVIHMPANYAETIWDLSYVDGKTYLKLTRFLSSLWLTINKPDFIHSNQQSIQIEVSEGEIRENDFTVREINLGIARNCIHETFKQREGDQYKLLFLDSDSPYEADITEPYKREDTEHWQRLINRLIGTGLSLPRRYVAA
jgi:hypothetical protein